MAKNLIDNDSFEFIEGVEKTEYDNSLQSLRNSVASAIGLGHSNQIAITNLRNSIHYAAYTTYSEEVNTAGYITDNGTSLRFTMPLSKRILSGMAISQIVQATIRARQNGNYVLGSVSEAVNVNSSPYTLNISEKESYLIINITGPFSNPTNNDAAGVTFNLSFQLGSAS